MPAIAPGLSPLPSAVPPGATPPPPVSVVVALAAVPVAGPVGTPLVTRYGALNCVVTGAPPLETGGGILSLARHCPEYAQYCQLAQQMLPHADWPDPAAGMQSPEFVVAAGKKEL